MLTVLPIPSNISSQLIYFIHSSCSLNSLPQMAPRLLFPHWELLDCSLSLWVCFCFAAAAAKSLQSCPTLSDPTDGSPPGSAVPGILQVRTLEWVAISFSSAWKWKVKVKSLSHPTLHDPMDCHLLGSSIHGIFQARVLEWGAIPYSGLCV